MGLTTIDFYFNAAERLAVACRLAGKAVQQGKRVLVYAPQPELAQRIDRMLWTWQAISFLPHCYADDALAAETPVLIGAAPVSAPGCEILINLDGGCPPFFERHERLLEIVSADQAERQAGRARYAFYRDRGYAIRSHDLAAEVSQ
ncbi:MAG: DNA polymerase III subunit chi [Pseudomonadota bacterium]